MVKRALVLVVVCLGLAVGGVHPLAQTQGLTPEIIVGVAQVADAQISPDGERVLYQVSRQRGADEAPGGSKSELWMVPAAGGTPVRFTSGNDRSARWSSDGSRIAFLSRRNGSTQVHVMAVAGGEAQVLTDAPNDVGSFKWSPDGTRIAYTVTDPKTKEEKEAEAKGQDWSVADANYKHTRLYAVDVASKASTLVAKADLTVYEYDWSPDGTQIVMAAADTPLVDDSYMKRKLHVVSSSGGVPEPFVETEGKLTNLAWSPDGKWIAWLGATSIDDPYAGSAFVVPAAGGTPENLMPAHEGTATALAWQPGAPSTVTFVTIERQQNALRSMELPGKAAAALVTGPAVFLRDASYSRDGTRAAFAASTPSHPYEAFVVDLPPGTPRRVTTTNPQLEGVALGAQEIVKWKAADGLEIEGVIVKPVGYEAGRRYPTIVQPHGGPESADLNGWLGTYSRWGQMLAARGYVTFYPNYRGSIGRGVAFSKADHKDLMGKEFQDMLDGIDHLIQLGITDGDRVGIGGGSYGGYTSAWAATYGSARFKASVMWMGISNWYSMTGTSDIFFENSTVHWNLMMYDNLPIYWDRSPIAHIARANTPTLIIHGAADPRVPIGQSQEMYTALKWKGVPAEFVTYPREGHGVGERAHQLDFMNRVMGWYDRYVKVQVGT